MTEEKAKHIAELLEAEILAARRYGSENFGMAVGEGFAPMCRAIVANDNIASSLAADVLITALLLVSFKETVGLAPSEMVRKSPNSVKSFLEMFYCGVQVGRKLQVEEALECHTS